MSITLSEAARLSGGALHPDSDGALVLRYVCADSREALHVDGRCLPRLRASGRTAVYMSARFLTRAAQRFVSDRALFVRNTILVDDVRGALARLARLPP